MDDFPQLLSQPVGSGVAHSCAAQRGTAAGDSVTFGARLLDEIGLGLIVCDSLGVVRYVNRAARRELQSAAVLGQRGAVLCAAAGSGSMLERALRQACVRGQRRVLTLQTDGDRLTLSITPFVPGGAHAAHALVTLGRRGACQALGVELLAAGFELTAAESRVMRGLVESRSPKAIASAAGVSMTTVRTQIASIRSKFGVRSVGALLIRAAELPPIVEDDSHRAQTRAGRSMTLAA